MKKFLVVCLILGAATGVFAPRAAAQFSWNLTTDFNTGLLSWNMPTGEKAQKYITVNGGEVFNENVAGSNPVNDRGDYTFTSWGMDIFSYGRGTWLRANELRLTVDFHSDAVEFHTRTLLDELVRAEMVRNPGNPNVTGGGHSLVSCKRQT